MSVASLNHKKKQIINKLFITKDGRIQKIVEFCQKKKKF